MFQYELLSSINKAEYYWCCSLRVWEGVPLILQIAESAQLHGCDPIGAFHAQLLPSSASWLGVPSISPLIVQSIVGVGNTVWLAIHPCLKTCSRTSY